MFSMVEAFIQKKPYSHNIPVYFDEIIVTGAVRPVAMTTGTFAGARSVGKSNSRHIYMNSPRENDYLQPP
jgi:hypothetical protein